ncbi:MAG: glycerophosphodiester phosphodiesterase [Chloroflexi bacterium]|nr:glycerophosphodiester phosphodiesterase [Chloroflexota bacterium]
MGALRLAHRGDWRVAPENSLAAMRSALSNPRCDGLELDVRTSADGVPVLSHDETLERVHGRPDRVDALTAAELSELGVPTLADVLAIVPRTAFLDIELKSPPARSLREVIANRRPNDDGRTVVSSFEPDILRAVASEGWPWPRWGNSPVLLPFVIETATELGCSALSVDWHAIDAEAAAAVTAAGLTLAAWTVQERDVFERLESLGVTAMCVEGDPLDG